MRNRGGIFRCITGASVAFALACMPALAQASHAPTGELTPRNTPATYDLLRTPWSTASTTTSTAAITLPFRQPSALLAADLGTDGTAELVLASGPGEEPMVSVHRQDGTLIGSFSPFPNTVLLNGMSLAVGNFVGDATPEIAVGRWAGHDSTIALFTNRGTPLGSFLAFAPSFSGGVTLTTLPWPGASHDFLAVGAGVGGGPHVRVYSGDGVLQSQFFASAPDEIGGVNLLALPGSDRPTLLATPFAFGPAKIRSWIWSEERGWQQSSTTPAYATYPYGVALLAGQQTQEFLTIPMHGYGGTHVKTWVHTQSHANLAYEFFLGPAGKADRAVCTSTPSTLWCVNTAPILRTPFGKHILVEATPAQLTAYEYGLAMRRFLVSVGIGSLTPMGAFAVQRKKHWHDYVRFYAPGDRRNYSFKQVEFNLQFKPSYYIHYAYWHNHWGHRMSHGCVNAPYEGVKWLYAWSEVGTPITIAP